MIFGLVDCLADTNILLRLERTSDPRHQAVLRSALSIAADGGQLYYCSQSIAELWNAATRPAERNGLGLGVDETEQLVQSVERNLVLLPDISEMYPMWRTLVLAQRVRGVQVHDARLVALMQAHGLRRILTLNGPDFRRYKGIEVVEPGRVGQ